jgi:hypothetical protein
MAGAAELGRLSSGEFHRVMERSRYPAAPRTGNATDARDPGIDTMKSAEGRASKLADETTSVVVGEPRLLTTRASAAGRAEAAADQGQRYPAAAEALTPRQQQALVRRYEPVDHP